MPGVPLAPSADGIQTIDYLADYWWGMDEKTAGYIGFLTRLDTFRTEMLSTYGRSDDLKYVLNQPLSPCLFKVPPRF